MGCGHGFPIDNKQLDLEPCIAHGLFKLLSSGYAICAYQEFCWTETIREALIQVDPEHTINSHDCWWLANTPMRASNENSNSQVLWKIII